MVPPLLPSPRTVTPMPAMVKRLPTTIGIVGAPTTDAALALGGGIELQQRDIGGGAMRRHRLHAESGMDRDVLDVLQLRLPVRAVFDDLVGRAGLHAMRRRQHQLRRDQRAGAEIAARADDGDDGAADAVGRRRAAADDGMSGRGEQQRQAGDASGSRIFIGQK